MFHTNLSKHLSCQVIEIVSTIAASLYSPLAGKLWITLAICWRRCKHQVSYLLQNVRSHLKEECRSARASPTQVYRAKVQTGPAGIKSPKLVVFSAKLRWRAMDWTRMCLIWRREPGILQQIFLHHNKNYNLQELLLFRLPPLVIASTLMSAPTCS